MFFVCGTVKADPDELREFINIVLTAARLPSVEKLAHVLEIDVKQLRANLRGEGHLSLTRIIAKLGSEDLQFWPRLGLALISRHGLPIEAQRTADTVMALLKQEQPLVDTDRAEKRSA